MTNGISSLIIVPTKIKIGLYSIMVREKIEDLIAICGGCGKDLDIGLIKHDYTFCCESEWIFCSEKCMTDWVKNNEPEGGY